jgi:hypothetical protein
MLYGTRYAFKVLAEPFGKIHPAFWLGGIGVGAYFMAPVFAAVSGLDQASPQKESVTAAITAPVPAATPAPPATTYVSPPPVQRPAYVPPTPTAQIEVPVGEPLNILPDHGGGGGGGGGNNYGRAQGARDYNGGGYRAAAEPMLDRAMPDERMAYGYGPHEGYGPPLYRPVAGYAGYGAYGRPGFVGGYGAGRAGFAGGGRGGGGGGGGGGGHR